MAKILCHGIFLNFHKIQKLLFLYEWVGVEHIFQELSEEHHFTTA